MTLSSLFKYCRVYKQ